MLQYTLSLTDRNAHLFRIAIDLHTNGAPSVDLEFPAWSPGRYFIYDFARNVQDLNAHGGDGTALRVERQAKGTWRVYCEGHDAVTLSYRMFGDTLSGTFSQLDDRHASINGPSVFGYISGRQSEPVELSIDAPESWKVFTALRRRRRAGVAVYSAPNYDALIDAPIEIGRPMERRFVVEGVTYHVVLDLSGTQPAAGTVPLRGSIDRYLTDLEAIVTEYTATFGRPEFDAFYFLVNIDPYAANGDGMEHQASTRLVLNGSLMDDDAYNDLLDVSSHEFFHVWNVKRLRPAELGPFDYTSERHTTLLWFAEGFTQYYGHLMVRRAGVWDDRQFYKKLVEEINIVDQSPGRFHRNLRASSYDTWFAAGARNPISAASNFQNTYVNYYHKGAVTALLLDLELRRRSGGRRSLDDLIHELYRSSYAEAPHEGYYLRGHGYSEQDVLDAAGRVGGRGVREFLARAIAATGDIDYDRHLRFVGLRLERRSRTETTEKKKSRGTEDGAALLYTGLVVPDAKGRANDPFVRVVNVLAGSPAARAGFSAGDLILAVNDERVDGRRWEQVLAAYQAGARLRLAFFRGAGLRVLDLATEERDARPFRIEPIENASAVARRARAGWLGRRGR